MQLFRRAANPWGEEVLLGIAWDLMWAALAVGLIFLVVHATLAARRREAEAEAKAQAEAGTAGTLTTVPPRIMRHGIGARLFHWSMAAAMLALLATAFVPVMGWQFDWVTIHWIAGLALIVTVVYHIIQALFWQSFKNIWAGVRELREGARELGHFVSRSVTPQRKPGKYPVAQKLFHHVATLAALAAIVTGLLMMVRIETPILRQNQYLLSDPTWGIIYVVHGIAGVSLITLVIAHIYFAIRPEKRWLTRAMIKGWITREEYLAHHDPERWAIGAETEARSTDPVSVAPAGRSG